MKFCSGQDRSSLSTVESKISKKLFPSFSCRSWFTTFWLNFIFNYYGPSFIIVEKAHLHFQLPKNKGLFITREAVENEIQQKSNKGSIALRRNFTWLKVKICLDMWTK